jgi:hypothetical protein
MIKRKILVLLTISVFQSIMYGQVFQSKVTVVASRVPNTVDKKVLLDITQPLTNFII